MSTTPAQETPQPPAGYFDAASATPLHPLAKQAFLSTLEEGWADPTRLYRSARQARMLLDAAREATAAELGTRPDELTFTPSGTHAVHTGIQGTLTARRRTGRHLLHSAVEHSSVLHTAEQHQATGGTASTVPVNRQGRVSPQDFAEALRAHPDTALACLQSANHEVGTLQPVAETAEVCAAAGVPLLVDAAQSAGRLDIPSGWSVLTASAHKWGGPPGVGILAVRKGTRFASPHPADERESGRAPGFTNIPAIVAAAVALRAVRAEAAAENARLRALVDRLRTRVPELVPDVEIVGDPEQRLPHLLTFSCLYVDGEALLGELDRSGFAVSSGSSCTSSTLTPSHVLAAMGVLTEGNIRISLPNGTPESEIDRFLAVLPEAVSTVRAKLSPTPPPPSAPSRPEGETGPLVLDTLGRRCPIPIIELAKHINDVPPGGTIAVVSDDEAARLDVPAWCEMRGETYLGEAPAPDYGLPSGTAYLVRRTAS